MTRAPVSPRAPRGRVLVVGDDALVSRIGLDASTTPTATNLFDAVGHLTLAPAREPVERIIIGFDEIRDRVADVVNAIHRLDPGVGLVAVIDQGDEDAAAIARASGFDDVIELAPRGTTAAVPPLSAVVEVEPPPLPEAPPLPEPPAPAMPAPDPLVGDELLGDVDLVDAILEDRGPVVETALRVLRQQPGLSGVVFCERGADAPPGAVDVVHGPRSFGAIHAAGCTAAELASWARWLSRWLALEAAHRRLWRMAYTDDLTDAWNRRFFDLFLPRTLERARNQRQMITLMVLDIDDFKHYNDEYGHDVGDEVLRETVRLLKSVIRRGDRVFRIGGDEFVVVFSDPEGPREAGSTHPASVETIAKRFQSQLNKASFPKLGVEGPGPLSVSGGLACFPWDGTDAQTLLRIADQLSLQSKRKGKNLITFGPEARTMGD